MGVRGWGALIHSRAGVRGEGSAASKGTRTIIGKRAGSQIGVGQSGYVLSYGMSGAVASSQAPRPSEEWGMLLERLHCCRL